MNGHQFSDPTVSADIISSSSSSSSFASSSTFSEQIPLKALVPVRGRTVPWNTFAIWDVNALGTTGFPLIGDGVAGRREIGGVEVSVVYIL
jgi:hypothetical protein